MTRGGEDRPGSTEPGGRTEPRGGTEPGARPPEHGGPPALLTFGHGTASHEELLARLRAAGVQSVVDVRTAPGSRRNPDAGREALARRLPAAGIAYRWEPRLGGFRRAAADSPDAVWRNASFRGYAGHARSPQFVAAVDTLLEEAARTRTAVMCSESVWWRCHRRIIADFAEIARGRRVLHLMPNGALRPHVPTAGARLRPDGLLVYDAAPDAPEPQDPAPGSAARPGPAPDDAAPDAPAAQDPARPGTVPDGAGPDDSGPDGSRHDGSGRQEQPEEPAPDHPSRTGTAHTGTARPTPAPGEPEPDDAPPDDPRPDAPA